MVRKDFQALARVRLREAAALCELGLFDGAYYLAGYAVECALKACLAKGTVRHEFPDKKKVDSSYSHDLWELLKLAGLEKERVERARQYPGFDENWEVVKSWSEKSRYQRNEPEEARQLVHAVGDRRNGILSWLKQHW